MKKIVLISLFVSILFSFDILKPQDINIHSHNHTHIQGSVHIHEHIHVETTQTLFYNLSNYENIELISNILFIDFKTAILNPIINNIFRPPIF